MNKIESKSIHIYLLNEGGFKSIDKEGFLSYEKLGIRDQLESFISNRLKHFGFMNISLIQSAEEIKSNDSEYSCIVNFVNPFIDSELILKMAFILKQSKDYDCCIVEGAIPGTEPDLVFRTASIRNNRINELRCLTYTYNSQSKYNNQFNLRKLKRIKMFLKVKDLIKNLEILTIPEIIEKLHKKEIFEKLVTYGEDVDLIYIEKCPCCGAEIQPILSNVSQPLIGYLPYDKPLHFQCVECKLIMMSPYVDHSGVEKLYDYYYSESQAKDYFIRKKRRYTHYDTAIKMVENHMPTDAAGIDLGCGAGAFIFHTKEKKPKWNIIGCDLGDRVGFFKKDHKEIKVLHLNFLIDDLGESKYDIITAWEVIEHVSFEDLHVMLNNVHKALKPGGIFLFSTPDFDSPLCQIFDFWSSCPPYHPLIYSKSWINFFFKDNKQFKILKIENESAMMDVFESWFSYWKSTSKEFESRATAKLLLEFLKDKKAKKSFEEFIKNKEWGVEMIVALKKR